MAKNFYDITLALAGVHQSAFLVHQLAHSGQCDSRALHTMLNSILQTDPPSTLAVYGNEEDLKPGLQTLLALFGNNQPKVSNELVRYCMNLVILSRKLLANNDALSALSNRIGQLERQLNHFAIDSDNLIGAMADIYVDVISPLGSRIQVIGSPDVLAQSIVQAKVRAALLAGIRSAVLWQQVGGRRLQFLFSRRRLCEQAENILAHC